jgi:hypothetical protein
MQDRLYTLIEDPVIRDLARRLIESQGNPAALRAVIDDATHKLTAYDEYLTKQEPRP